MTNVVFDPHITRGFDYYTGMVFEVFDTNPENARSLFGGGRYDGLVALYGGDPVPAIGFGMGDVTLADFLETHSLKQSYANAPQLYLGTPATSDAPVAQAFADTLRKDGVRAFVNLTTKGLGDQIKDAVKRGIPYFVAYGSEEVASGTIRVKNLEKSTEETIPASSLSVHLRPNN